MRFLALIIVTLCFIPHYYGQHTIESHVLKEVNHLRDSLHLKRLRSDHVLFKAAEDHAYYMGDKKTLNHFQLTFSKESPSERVLFYDGNRTYVGENIANVTAKWTEDGLHDSLAAQQLYKSWLNSPPHYANMIDPNFTRMGLAIKVIDSSVVYAAQVFSSNEIRLPAYFKNSHLSWGVRPSEKTCKDQTQTYETMYFANSVLVEGSDIYFYFHDKDFFQHVVYKDNDGLALDIVVREQFPCHKENQLHISKVYDGEMQRPIYKHDIYRNDESNNPRKIKIKIGTVPPHLRNKQWDANIIIINDNQLCDYSVPVEVPSDIFPLLDLKPYYENDSGSVDFTGRSVHIEDSMHIELNYERSQNKFSDYDMGELGRLLSWGPFVKNASVECYASVEGDHWFNHHLLQKRQRTAEKLLIRNGYSGSKLDYLLSENWEMMEEQIINHDISNLQGKTQNQIKQTLKGDKTDLIDSLLFEQRKTHIYAKVDTTITVSSFEELVFAQPYDDSLSMNQLPWNRILRDNHIIPDQAISKEIIDSLAEYTEIKTNLLAAATLHDTEYYLDSVLVERLIKSIDLSSSKQSFNYIHFLSKYWFARYARRYETNGTARTVSPNNLRLILSKLDTLEIAPFDLLRLDVNLLLSGIHYHVSQNNWGPVDMYFTEISNLVKSNAFTAEEARELASFFFAITSINSNRR